LITDYLLTQKTAGRRDAKHFRSSSSDLLSR